MAGGGSDGRSVAEKLFAIADAFRGREDLTLTEIAGRARLPLSTAHRLVAEWVEWGGIVRGDDGLYRLGLKLWRLGVREPNARRLRAAARPYLGDLWNRRANTCTSRCATDSVSYTSRGSRDPTRCRSSLRSDGVCLCTRTQWGSCGWQHGERRLRWAGGPESALQPPASIIPLSGTGSPRDVIELNEAFAVQVLACLADWGLDAEDPRLNPRGSGISLGHPIGATGVRMLATLAHELPALDGSLAPETMCIGGGQALAAVFERV